MTHRTVSDALEPYNSKPATLGNSRARSTIIHRTVRWTSRAMTPCVPTVDWQDKQCATVPQQESERRSQREPNCPVWHRTVYCSKTTKAPTVDRLRTLMVALTWHAPDSAQWLSGGALSGAPIASRIQPTARSGWEAINTPNHLIHFHPSISEFSFITRTKAQHSKTQSKQSIHSKPQNQL
jgi:hypothetical protein